LLEGHAAIPVLEALDQRGILVDMLAEWAPNRCRPQRNAYHRFTVDRHLWETAANAAELADRVRRPDLLVLGALLHDIGKGYPGDHTEVGMELVRAIGTRMGLTPSDTDVLVALVEHHLLLPDVATRRDLTDPGTIESVAAAVGSAGTLDLLYALTEADSLATGPSAWGGWKAELMGELVGRVHHVLGGGDVEDIGWHLFPSAEISALMGAGEVATMVDGDRITVVAPDRPGLFSSVAGVFALSGLDVMAAQAHSDEQGMAANQFRVVIPKHGFDWERLDETLHHALAGRLALEARLAEKARTYRRRKQQAARLGQPSVRIDNETSYRASVVEVRAPDRLGVLHRVTKAMAELRLDIRHAKVQTLGDEVVDTFYVRTSDGSKVDDPFYVQELERALLHSVS
jgi:[protein-PII] uridylyltransferase